MTEGLYGLKVSRNMRPGAAMRDAARRSGPGSGHCQCRAAWSAAATAAGSVRSSAPSTRPPGGGGKVSASGRASVTDGIMAHEMPPPGQGRKGRGGSQCDITTGTVSVRISVRVTPPSSRSISREWP